MPAPRRLTRRAALQRAAAASATIAGSSLLPELAAAAGSAAGSVPTTRLDAPVVVVGTGYGGAVTALRLAQAGVPVLMLEMGRAWDRPGRDGKIFCPTLRPDGRAMWFRSRTRTPLNAMFGIPIDMPIQRYPGVLDRLDFPDMAVYVGRGVGGGSLVNGGMAVTPRRADFERLFPQVDAAAMYDTYFPRANAELQVSTPPVDWFERTPIHQFSRVARAQAERAGFDTAFVPSIYSYDYMVEEAAGRARKSATAQEIFYGSNHGKHSLDKTYLAAALATGNVTIASLRTVTSVRAQPDGRYRLSVNRINTSGVTVAREEIACDRLVLAAGTMGTTELLLRARATGAIDGLSDRIGEGWGNNGNVTVARWNPLRQPTGTRQTTMPAMGIDHRDDPVLPTFVEITPMPTGFENFTSSYLAITRNPERGRLRYDAATDRVQLDWKRAQAAASVKSLKAILDPINRQQRTAYRSDLYTGGRVWGDHYTWHPLGGCILGEATDLYGRVDGAPGLYVNDGSLLPGYATVNPFVTITALAERNVEQILADVRGA